MTLPTISLVVLLFARATVCDYVVDDTPGLGRRFDGIGGLSGGGATSRLLPTYSEQQKQEILDILFEPNFAASLHILKVEIGGDGQSTDGTESSHMHSEDDENYKRGYEWWLMTEAKKRNPKIKLYGLPWAFPAWVGGGTMDPFKYPNLTATYITNWVKGAKTVHNLNIDYVGIWNEHGFDTKYIKLLRHRLDETGLKNVQIVASDGGQFTFIADAVTTDSELSAAVSILGAHYPGTVSPAVADDTGKPLWSSEDFSSYNDAIGAGCWARIINQNYVNGNMTSTIAWNLITSYYEGLPLPDCSLMTANEPWSGHYDISGPIYITAHTTQFTQPGDMYLQHGSGVGKLDHQGSYVSFTDNDGSLTIVIETMSHDHSVCIRPYLPPYTVQFQLTTFQLKGKFAGIKELHRWDSQLKFDIDEKSEYFIKNGTVTVNDGSFTIALPTDHVVTLSTKTGQIKGAHTSPPSAPFPIPYSDNFDSYDEFSEASYFADQAGVFEIRKSNLSPDKKGMVMTQVVPEHVISWCDSNPDSLYPITLFGSNKWSSVSFNISVRVPTKVEPESSTFIAAVVSGGGCGTPHAQGLFFWLNLNDGNWRITTDLAQTKVYAIGTYQDFKIGHEYTLSISVKDGKVDAGIDGETVHSGSYKSGAEGFIGFGTSGYFAAEFDDFNLMEAS